MTTEQKYLLGLLAKALFGREIGEPEGVDWEKLFFEARAQAVTLIAYDALNKESVPEELLSRWKNAANAVLMSNIRVIRNHVVLNDWMSRESIPYVFLKGCVSASFYPDPVRRTMGDVDFLVPSEFVEPAARILESKGLTALDNHHPSHIVYYDKVNTYELHFSVVGIPENDEGKRIREYLKSIFEDSFMKDIEFGRVCFPADFYHGLIMLIHTCSHLSESGIGLRHMSDWAVFVNRFTSEEFRELFEEKLKAVGLWNFAKILTRVSSDYLGADEKEFARDADPETAAGLIEDMLEGGNFGGKDESRRGQAVFITTGKEKSVDRNGIFKQYVKAKNETIREKWPAAKKCPLLLPIGWVSVAVTHVFGVITGKRKRTFTKKIMDGAAARKELYSRLKMYERE